MNPRITARLAIALVPIGIMGCELPPIDTQQTGYRGLGMVEVDHRRTTQEQLAVNEVPEPLPAIPAGTPPASSIYTNLQVLGDLSLGDFQSPHGRDHRMGGSRGGVRLLPYRNRSRVRRHLHQDSFQANARDDPRNQRQLG